jgi:hypothetical protein
MIDTARLWRESPFAAAVRGLRRLAGPALPTHRLVRLAGHIWWPFEAGSELPALYARDSNHPYPAYLPDRNGTDLMVLLQFVQRRVRLQRTVTLAARTLWLALAVALILMLARLAMPVPGLAIAAAAAVVLLLGYLYHRAHPVTIWTAARLLDRHWRLGEQLTTAIELAITPAPVRLAARQIAGALATVRDLRTNHRFRPRAPWVELQMAAAVGLLVAGLSLIAGPGERLAPPPSPIAPEGLDPALAAELGYLDPELQAMQAAGQTALAEANQAGLDFPVTDPTVDLSGIDSEALRQAAELSNRSARELEQIAEALKDASVTSQAAQDIQAGDYASAAQRLADLAKAIENLSPQARADLAQRLQQAANNIESMDPELARRLEQAAKALASRSDRAAAQGLEDLSRAVSETGKNVLSQQQLAEALDRMGERNASLNDDGPSRGRSGEHGESGGQAALGEGEAGEFGFGLAESALAVGVAGGLPMEDGSGGSGAGQGHGSGEEQYTPRLNPNQERVVAPVEQAPGPTSLRLGKAQPGAPEVITAGPGTTGPGNVPQGGLPITTGLDANRVPRGLRPVVEGYFRNVK